MVQLGNLYFIKQSFFNLVQDNNLSINKPDDENGKHGRPAFCVIKIDQSNYYWVIPFSHQIEKYQKIYDKNIQKYGGCDTIEFGYVLGEKKALLLQNMFPVTEQYFEKVYIDKNTKKPIELSNKLKHNFNKIISLYSRKGVKLIFTDINKILQTLNII
ncbi:hypothetical protein NMU03_13100 [Allocoprobacillus halotolerans]|uniref:Uncharacterized protein n=1 Tax=Allocoprobacillus halotolerans TaxID=2944914 RepID=A0ABY5I1D3_9FIRM|nr:hypothetical protein [Allocoprobacillus halotolerans]UTY38572.1 hypothetical protein NMU03_13100 [Allocoprobacillus halotolerans]